MVFHTGPHENYSDRKSGAFVGTYSSTVSELDTGYIYPQEFGCRSDVRWVRFCHDSKHGVQIACDASLLQFSAHEYPSDMLDGAKHTTDLARRNERNVNFIYVDHAMQGVGGVRESAIRCVRRSRLTRSITG